MKLAKLSLAAIVAVGTMTSFASATPLEEAIKGVDVSGMVRYRFYGEDGFRDNRDDRHRFSVPFNFTIPVADNLKAGVNLRYESNNYAKNDALDAGNLNTTKVWFLYSQPTWSLKAGRFEMNTPWTDPGYAGNRGDGALALYTGVDGWTFAGAGFVNSNINVPLGGNTVRQYLDLDAVVDIGVPVASVDVGEENVYALAAIGAIGPVNVQAWAATMEHVFDYSVFLQADMKYEGFKFKAQANQLKLADELDVFADNKGLFWAAEAGFGMAGFNVAAGYIKNDEDQPVHTLSADDAGTIKFGKQLYYETTNLFDTETIYITAGYKVDAYRFEAGFGSAEINGVDFGDEWYVGAGYKYSKNFDLSFYYSDLNMDTEDADFGIVSDDVDNKQFRFQAIYTF